MFNDFKFAIPVTRAYTNAEGEMFFEGTASSTSIDTFHTVFNRQCQEGFSFDVIRGLESGEPVELEAEHLGEEEPMNILGALVSAVVTEEDKLKVTARLDADNPKAVYYFKKMTVPDPITGKTKQFGLSINGTVETAHFEYSDELRKNIRVFDRVKLKRVGIVRKPSNPDSWIEKIIRSVEWSDIETMSEEKEVERNGPDLKQLIAMLMHIYQAMEMMEMEEPEEEEMPESESEDKDDSEEEDEYNEEQLMMAVEYMSNKIRGWMKKRMANTSNMAGSIKEDLSDEVVYLNRAQYDGIDFTPSEAVKSKLKKGLKLYEDGKGGKGLVPATVSWARKLAAGESITPEKARKMSAWHARHSVDKRPGWDKAGEETPGYVANLLWGGEPGREWADRLVKAMEKKDSEMKETRQEEVVLDSNEAVEAVAALEVEQVEVRNEEEQVEQVVTEEVVEEVVAEAEVEVVAEEVVVEEVTERSETSIDSVVEAAASMIDEKIAELRSMLESVLEENKVLRQDLSEVKNSNVELIERLQKIESEPASKPGSQLIESITRQDSNESKREENLKRAREMNDTQELIKHKLFGSKYLGYGQFS
jgi:hypothetical protein